MQVRLKLAVLCLTAIVVGEAGGAPASARAAGIAPTVGKAAGELRVEPSRIEAKVGGSIVLRVVSGANVDIAGAQASARFDAGRLQVTKATTGQPWSAAGATSLGIPTPDAMPGVLGAANMIGKLPAIGVAFVGDARHLPPGDAELLELTFEATACGDTPIELPIGPGDGAILDGRTTTYGESLAGVKSTGAVVHVACPEGGPLQPSDPSPLPPTPVLEPTRSARATELVDLRTATTDTFDNGDGTRTTTLYSAPVYYRPDDDAGFEPIKIGFHASDKKGGAISAKAPAVVAVAPAAHGSFLTVNTAGHAIHLLAPDRAALSQDASARPILDGARADLTEVLPGIGARVLARPDGVHTFFRLDGPQDADRLTVRIEAPGLDLRAGKGGAYEFLDGDGDVVARMPAPYAVDSTVDTGSAPGRLTMSVVQTVVADGPGWQATLVVDPAWLKSAVYPVWVDPSIVLATTSEVADAHVSSASPDTNYANYCRPDAPSYCELWLGQDPSGTTGEDRVYLRFDTSSISGSSISSASLSVFAYEQYYDAPTAITTWIDRPDSAWAEDTITWNTKPASHTAIGSFSTIEGQAASYDLTPTVRGWVNSSIANHGVRLWCNGCPVTAWKRLISSEQGGSNTPRLSVTYAVAVAVQGSPTLHPANAGADSGYETLWSPDTTATPQASSTISALAQLQAGTIQVAAIDRPLTANEAASFCAWQVGTSGQTPLYEAVRRFDVASRASNVTLVRGDDWINYLLSASGQAAVAAAGLGTVPTPAAPPIPDRDIDLDGGIGLTDIGQVTGNWNATSAIKGWIRPDIDNNGGVGLSDIGQITGHWGEVSFTTPSVSLVYPLSGATSSRTLAWRTDRQCWQESYQVQVASDPGFGTLVASSGIVADPVSSAWSIPPTASLVQGTTYYWRVQVKPVGGAWSSWASGSFSYDPSVLGLAAHHRHESWDLGGGDSLAVDVSTLNAVISHPVVSLPYRGGRLDLSLVGNSQDPTDVGLGPGWQLDVQRRIENATSGAVILVDASGARHRFDAGTPSGGITPYTRPSTRYGTLTRNDNVSPARFALTHRDQTIDTFEVAGTTARLIRTEDRFGNALTFSYIAGNLTTIRSGRSQRHPHMVRNPGSPYRHHGLGERLGGYRPGKWPRQPLASLLLRRKQSSIGLGRSTEHDRDLPRDPDHHH